MDDPLYWRETKALNQIEQGQRIEPVIFDESIESDFDETQQFDEGGEG